MKDDWLNYIDLDEDNTNFDDGREHEREVIVAWLRRLAIGNTSVDAAYLYAANSIENGEHLEEE